MTKLFGFGLLLLIVSSVMKSNGSDVNSIDCTKPPITIDPHTCCSDPGANEVAVTCAKRFNLPLPGDEAKAQQNQMPPPIEARVCFADCVLKDSKFIDGENFNKKVMAQTVQKDFAQDPQYATVMIAAFEACAISANQKMDAIRKMPMADRVLNGHCSPYAGIILGCTYTEYFKNCPENRWTTSPGCEEARNYVKKCVN